MRPSSPRRSIKESMEAGSPGFALFSNMNCELPASAQLKEIQESVQNIELDLDGFSPFVSAAEIGEYAHRHIDRWMRAECRWS